jgi:hypothetical protein
MVMELTGPLIDRGKNSGLNECHGCMPFLLQKQQKKET